MKKLPLLLILIFAGWLPAQSLADYPDITQVLEYFYSNYLGNPADDQVITFARKGDGWHIQKQPYGENHKVIDSEIFWSTQTKSYLPLRYPKLPINSAPNIAYHTARYFRIINWNAYNYQRCLYYGYPEWANDLVKALGDSSNLSPENLEGLARAYDFLANQILFSTYGIPHPSYQPLEGQKLEDKSRLQSYLASMDRSIATLKELVVVAPEFDMLTGSPQIKLANQYMTAWMQLIGAGQPELAEKYALQADFDEFTTNISAFQMEAIPKNGRFISFGDNDFFPLLALQIQKKFRPDVIIVHYHLLNAAWYQNLMMDSLGISFPNYQLDQLRKGFLILESGADSIRSRVYESSELVSMPTLKSGMSRYLQANQLIFQKLIENSSSGNPLCISWFADPQAFSFLSNYLIVKGLVYELTTSPPRHGQYDPMMQQFGYLEVETASSAINSLIESDWTWFQNEWDTNSSNKLFGTGMIRFWVTVLYHQSLLLNNVASETEEDVIRRDQLVAKSRALETLFNQPDIVLAESAAEMAVIGYTSNMEWMGEEWEKRMYACLDEVDWDQSSRRDVNVRRGLLALEMIGYYYQESGRDLQKITLEQELRKYEARLTDY